MDFQDEYEFEKYIRELIDRHVSRKDKNIFALTNKKAVDILVCNNNDSGHLFLIEVKFHKHGHGRLGFGSGNGSGHQPEILNKQPKFFETNMRWVIGQEKNDKIYFMANSTLANYFAGGQIGEKQNNIQTRIFQEEQGLTEKEFIDALTKWLQNKNER